MIIGNAASERQEIIVVNEGTNDRDFTVGTSSNNTAINESMVNVKTLERCFNKRIEREMSNNVDTVEDRIQNVILTAIDNIVAPTIELAIRSINASSGWDVTSVTANSERGEHVRINASFENASGNNNTLHVSNVDDETRHNIPDEVSELSVPETHLDRQPHAHHSHLWTNRFPRSTQSETTLRNQELEWRKLLQTSKFIFRNNATKWLVNDSFTKIFSQTDTPGFKCLRWNAQRISLSYAWVI